MPVDVKARTLSALLSQALVAFTVELDNEFERRIGAAGHPGARLSLVVWLDLMRFLDGQDRSVSELASSALTPIGSVRALLGCLERWGYVELPGDAQTKRDGWGSGRGIRAGWIVRPTNKGRLAMEIWRPLTAIIEARWEARIGGGTIAGMRGALASIVDALDIELPQGLPSRWLPEPAYDYPARTSRGIDLSLPALLAQPLHAFSIRFDRDSDASLAFSANTIRVLGAEPVRAADVSRLTGCSPEMTDIGWQLKPYVVAEADPSGRKGKALRLTERGLAAQRAFVDLCARIETEWETGFGADRVRTLRATLLALFRPNETGAQAIAEGMIPPPGVVRYGDVGPALGRRDIGSAARRRARDLVAQTKVFIADPAGALPHYPLWDMNRGFGP
jgi:DNA-binding MarR family transcriptional regulator